MKWAALIAIDVILVGTAVFFFANSRIIIVPRRHPTTRARAETSEISKAIGIYRTLTGRWPASLDDLRRPQERNDGEPVIEIGNDPWGRPYGFAVEGTRTFTITCLGADGTPGGTGADEDIVLHWPPPESPAPR